MLKITVVQPAYFAGENPEVAIGDFLMKELMQAPKGGLVVLPEYSNAGGLSDGQDLKKAAGRAKQMLERAAEIAKEKSSFVAVNVLEERDGNYKNSTYLFHPTGEIAFVYDKIHLPPSEVRFGVKRGSGACVCEADGIRFGFLTCYDIYFSEQIEYLASQKPDIIVFPSYQRGESADILRAQTRLAAFRCNSFVAKASYSMGSDEKGGCSMIVSPDGTILCDLGKEVGSETREVEETWKYLRPAGYGGGMIRNDDFISGGLCPQIFDQ